MNPLERAVSGIDADEVDAYTSSPLAALPSFSQLSLDLEDGAALVRPDARDLEGRVKFENFEPQIHVQMRLPRQGSRALHRTFMSKKTMAPKKKKEVKKPTSPKVTSPRASAASPSGTSSPGSPVSSSPQRSGASPSPLTLTLRQAKVSRNSGDNEPSSPHSTSRDSHPRDSQKGGSQIGSSIRRKPTSPESSQNSGIKPRSGSGGRDSLQESQFSSRGSRYSLRSPKLTSAGLAMPNSPRGRPRGNSPVANKDPNMTSLASHLSLISAEYNVVIVGSGYGGSVVACRMARAGRTVCVLEKGKEWSVGKFPSTIHDIGNELQLIHPMHEGPVLGHATNLHNITMSESMVVHQACGLGGGSLLSAGVMMECDPASLQKNIAWPPTLRNEFQAGKEFARDLALAKGMLLPGEVPAGQEAVKITAIQAAARAVADIEDLGRMKIDSICRSVPVAINWKAQERNKFGVPQKACTSCGNCLTGCNVGAMNTLAQNYLPDARAHGAELYTETEVRFVERDPTNPKKWLVHYRYQTLTAGGTETVVQDFIVRCDEVFLAAGALHSAAILMRSKQRGLAMSDAVGQQFSGNGNTLAIVQGTLDPIFNVGTRANQEVEGPGPTTTCVIDLRNIPRSANTSVVHDVAVPGALLDVFALAIQANWKWSELDSDRFNEMDSVSGRNSIFSTLALLSVAKETVPSKLVMMNDAMHIEHDPNKPQTAAPQSLFGKISRELGGSVFVDPELLPQVGQRKVTINPLGGCPMGESAEDAVVNPDHLVFSGRTGQAIHEGLYVVDGSVLPHNLGVQPGLMITALAERACRRALQRKQIVAEMTVNSEANASALNKMQEPAGVVWVEEVHGSVSTNVQDSQSQDMENWSGKDTKGIGNRIYVNLTLAVTTLDELETRSYQPRGSVSCDLISPFPLVAFNGKFAPRVLQNDRKAFVWDVSLQALDGKIFSMQGIKFRQEPPKLETDNWTEKSRTMYVTLFEGPTSNRKNCIARGIARADLADFVHNINSLVTFGGHSSAQKKLQTEVCRYFAGSMWGIYGTVTCRRHDFRDNMIVRQKRPLNVGGVLPEVYPFFSKDGAEMRLTRYNAGRKGPIVLVHGLGTSSEVFTLDTINNLVEALVQEEYDVWLYDWRASILLPHIRNDFHLDIVIKFDHRVAIDVVRDISGAKDVLLLAHCLGAATFAASIIRGKLEGKIRAFICSQVGTHTAGGPVTKTKGLSMYADLWQLLNINNLEAYDNRTEEFRDKVLAWLQDTNRPQFLRNCDNASCQRASMVYSLQFEHGNLNDMTHGIAHEIFGLVNPGLIQDVIASVLNSQITCSARKKPYFPRREDKDQKPKLERHFKRWSCPTLFFAGDKNQMWAPSNIGTTEELLKACSPQVHYQSLTLNGYGNLDPLIGANAHTEVFPTLISWLAPFASIKPAGFEPLLLKAMNNPFIALVRRTLPDNRMLQCEQRFPVVYPRGKARSGELLADSKKYLPKSKNRAKVEKVCSEVWDKRGGVTDGAQQFLNAIVGRNEIRRNKDMRGAWRCKVKTDKYVHDCLMKRYPVNVTECKVKMEIEPVIGRKLVYVLSDLMLGGPRAHDFIERLYPVLESIVENAFETYAVVLLGDILDMCCFPLNQGPPSPEKYQERWTEPGSSARYLMDVMEELRGLGVQVYYVCGDSDQDITQEIIDQTCAEKDVIKVVSSTLILRMRNAGKEYRIRLEHGHRYDFFSSYCYPHLLLFDKPLGYYLRRAAAGHCNTDLTTIVTSAVSWLIRQLPQLYGEELVCLLAASTTLQERFLCILFEVAMGAPVDYKTVVELRPGAWTTLGTILKHPFFSIGVKKLGPQQVWEMVLAGCGVLDHIFPLIHEDVFISAHSCTWETKRLKSKRQDLVYTNSGCFLDRIEWSFVRLSVPEGVQDGELLLVHQFGVVNEGTPSTGAS